MTEFMHENQRFEIEPAKYEDAVAIGEAHLQSWLETYPNEEFGVTEEWIKDEFSFLVKDGRAENGHLNGIPFRQKVIKELDPTKTLYKVVRDDEGDIQGFMHADKTDKEGHINAVYLTNDLKGTGVAQELMNEALHFIGELPIALQVVAYNERAIKFYERNGFTKGLLDKEMFHGKMPVLNMVREVR